MKKNNISYLLRGTPSALLALGAGFVMASSADLRAALGMGAAVIISLLLSTVLITLLHKVIPNCVKVPAYILIITGFVTLITMLMDAWFPEVVNLLGVHLAALSVSAVIYRDGEEVADKADMKTSVITALITGAFLTVIMVVCALFREVLGNASIWGVNIPFLNDYKISSLAGVVGGYIVLAIVLAVVNKLTGLHKEEEPEETESAKEAE